MKKGPISLDSIMPKKPQNKEVDIKKTWSVKDAYNYVSNSDQNSEQTENKLSTQPRTELRTFSEQTTNKLRTNSSDFFETENKLSTQPRTELRTFSEQTTNKLRTNSSFSQLVGLQKKIIETLYSFCRVSGEKITDKLSLEFLATSCKANPAVVQVTTRRLIIKGVLSKFDSKEGRGGWTRYSLPEVIYRELFQLETENKLRTNAEQTESKLSTQPRTEPRTTPPCSSSNLNINNTTTTPQEPEPDLWLSVPKNLEGRVSLKQLRDFVKQGLITPEDLQSSLDGFSYDLAKNAIKSKLGNPVAILIGAVKSGGYISQHYLSELKASMADVERSRLEMRQIQSSLASEQIQKEFESFRAERPEEAEKFKPTSTYLTNFEPGSVGYKIWLEEYKKHQNMHHNEAANELAL